MDAKTKFEKMFNNLPNKSKTELVYDFANYPMTLNVCWLEIKNNTELGLKILNDLGFEDDKNKRN